MNMENALTQYLDTIKADYAKGQRMPEMVKQFNESLRVIEGKLYLKIVTSGVHSFIVKEDGPKFKKGDILKAASWAMPAKNCARGNIFTGYHTSWTGADYMYR